MEVIVEEEVRKVSGAMGARLIRPGVSPFSCDGLDEALGLAVGLRAVRLGEEMFDAKLVACGSEVVGAVGGASIGQDALDDDPVSLVELDCLIEGRDNASDLFIGQQTRKSQAGMIIDNNVEALDSGMTIADRAIASGAHPRTREAAQFFDVEMKELAGMSTFVALDRWFRRLQRGEPMQAMTAQDARDGGLGNLQHGKDLRVGAALPAQGQDVGFEFGTRLARLVDRHRGAVRELRRKSAFPGSQKPAANSPFADVISCGNLAHREIFSG